MRSTGQRRQHKFRIGLFYRAAGQSRFWGWGTPPVLKKAEATIPLALSPVPASVPQAARQKRPGYAGFVFWRKPRPMGASDAQRSLSLAESIQQTLNTLNEDEHGNALQSSVTPRPMWRAIRIFAPGWYFLGFIRR